MSDELAAIPQFPWYLYFTLLSVTLGACFGSFLNVCIYRIPKEIPTSKPARSFCPHCNKTIPWFYNIPLLSYIMLGGKCKFCEKKISARYFLVEGLTTILFILVWLKFDPSGLPRVFGLAPASDMFVVPVYWLMTFGLILGTFVDIEYLILPDRVTLGGIAAGLIYSALVPALHGADTILESLKSAAIGGALGWFSLWGVAIFGKMIFKKDAMGFGDVKLLGAIGTFLGWEAVLFNIFVSSLLGAIVGISFVKAGKKEMGSQIPFGPFIAIAAILWILWGPTWWQAYMDLMPPPMDSEAIQIMNY
jgi:leader peptidase (prepilin peptidase)/N-methyltransferase